MQFEPKALPFWEIQRGDGPCTRIENTRKTYKRTRSASGRGSEPVRALAEGCDWVSRGKQASFSIRKQIY